MDHTVCLNSNSFPADNSDVAYELFNDSLQGLLNINTGTDRYILYYDSPNSEPLEQFKLAEQLSYSEFKEKLLAQGEQDLFLFLEEFEDKSPAMDYLSEDVMEDLGNYSFYMPGDAIASNTDIFGLTWFLQAVMLSINTGEQWNQYKIAIARITDDGQFIDENLSISNIASSNHGQLLYDEFTHVDINTICDKCLLTEEFINWYEKQTEENCYRVIEKLKLSSDKDFQGGKPLFETLTDGDGLREIRFSAYSGGAIRILFKALGYSKQAILVGFIKKSNSEGYESNIKKATELFKKIEIQSC